MSERIFFWLAFGARIIFIEFKLVENEREISDESSWQIAREMLNVSPKQFFLQEEGHNGMPEKGEMVMRPVLPAKACIISKQEELVSPASEEYGMMKYKWLMDYGSGFACRRLNYVYALKLMVYMERDAISFHERNIFKFKKNYHRISRQGLISNPFGQRHGPHRRRWKKKPKLVRAIACLTARASHR